MTIADTCFLIDLMNGDDGAVAMTKLYNPLKTTAISNAEFLYGAKMSSGKRAGDVAEKFLRFFPALPFDAEAAVIYAGIAHGLSKTGRHISTFDELIAAIAIRNKEPLVTRDRHFSAIDGLEVIAY